MSHKSARWVSGSVLVVGLLVLAGCGQHQGPPTRPPTVVTVGEVTEEMVEDADDFTGRTESKEYVDIKARATGYLIKVLFKEGDIVKKGQVLYEIDPRTYEADLARSEADVVRLKATLERLQADLGRARRLSVGDAISREEYDKIAANAEETRAGVVAAQATVQGKKLNLEFCKVMSPIDGRISRTNATVGNLVTADTTILTTIVSVDPIYAYFNVEERTVLRVQKMIREGKFEGAGAGKQPPVFLGTELDTGYPHKGSIDFVDNRIDTSTGTLRVRGVFPNPLVEGPNGSKTPVLSPGLFVRIRVPMGTPSKRVVVPDSVFGSDQGERYVYILTSDNKVERRYVKVGRLVDGKRSVESGLKAGETIITNGMQRVRPGVTVEATKAPMPVR